MTWKQFKDEKPDPTKPIVTYSEKWGFDWHKHSKDFFYPNWDKSYWQYLEVPEPPNTDYDTAMKDLGKNLIKMIKECWLKEYDINIPKLREDKKCKEDILIEKLKEQYEDDKEKGCTIIIEPFTFIEILEILKTKADK